MSCLRTICISLLAALLPGLPAADVNGDGAINALDVVFVINQVLGL